MAAILPFSPAAAPTPDREPSPRRPRIGELLVRAGALAPDALEAALAEQAGQNQRLGRILVVNGLVSDEDLGAALSRQSGIGRIDLAASPPDPTLLAGIDPYRCLALEAIPWRQVGGTRIVAIGSPEAAEAAMAACGGGAAKVALALADPETIRRALTDAFAGRLRDDARARCPAAYSCRGWTEAAARPARTLVLAAAAIAATAAAPLLVLHLLLGWALVANALTMGLRLTALFTRFRRGPARPEHAGPRLADYKKLPTVSILVPLLREEKVARRLLEALEAMDYPVALLDIKLVLEADDAITRAALARAALPRSIEVIGVPPDTLRTKPKAMNYALPFCRGEIVGVYDAEDRPDPGQIRAVVRHLQAAPPEVACVQGYLDFYNGGDNWLARCFTLEYAIWFRVVLLGVQRLGLPIPLGGTSVFFRRAVLEELGGWDAHNVTEDADLGMRLARFGYRCEMIASTTWEEANCRVASLDPPALALAQGLRRHLGDAHAPAARALARPRPGRLPRLPDAVPRGDHLLPRAAAVLGRRDRRPRLRGAALANRARSRGLDGCGLHDRGPAGDADDRRRRGQGRRTTGPRGMGGGAAALLDARRRRGLARDRRGLHAAELLAQDRARHLGLRLT